jgi:hypothetical protein
MSSPNFAAVILFLLTAAAGFGAVQRVEQESFPLAPGGTVRFDAYRGAINVVAGAGDRVMVLVNLSLPAEAVAAQPVLDGFVLAGKSEGGVLTLTARNPLDRSARLSWNRRPRPEITYTLEVPAHVQLELQTADGSITVDSLRGRMQARARQGTIFFRQIDGSVDARTETGDVVVSRCTGDVTLRTVQGSIRIGSVGGRASLETMNGDIEFQAAHNAVLAVTKAGDITAGFASVADGSQVKTGFGNISAQVNADAAFSLHAQAGWGPLRTALPLESAGSDRAGRLTAIRNGGGPVLELRAPGGHVSLAPGDTFPPF